MLFEVTREGKCGFIDSSGRVVLPIQADRYVEYSEGHVGLFFGSTLHIYDRMGKEVGVCSELTSDGRCFFSQGLLSVFDNKSEKKGYIDVRGQWVISPQFRQARKFSVRGAVAVSTTNYNEGIIDKAGSWTCEPKYHQIFDFDEKTLCTVAYEAKEGGSLRCLFIDNSGQEVVDFQCDGAHGASEGLIPIRKGEKWGVISDGGELVVPCVFDGLNPFSEGYSVARSTEGKYGVIDKAGHWKIHPLYDRMDTGVHEGLVAAAVKESSGQIVWGYLSIDGEWIIRPKFADAYEFRDGLACVEPLTNDADDSFRFGYIDRNGQYIWEPY